MLVAGGVNFPDKKPWEGGTTCSPTKPKSDRGENLDDAPFALVTTATLMWKNRIVIPSGEVKPGVRSPEVWSAITR